MPLPLHHTLKHILPSLSHTLTRTISTLQQIATRPRDPTLEKYMSHYKNLLKVISIQDLILSNPTKTALTPQSISLPFLSNLSQKLRLNRGALSFIKKYPHIFQTYYNSTNNTPYITLTEKAVSITLAEAKAINDSIPVALDRLVRVLLMSVDRSVPLRAVFKVWKELGLPDDFEESVIGENCGNLFRLSEGNEVNTHRLSLVGCGEFERSAAVESWRVKEGCCSEERFSFKQGFPPGMRLRKGFKQKVKEWQRVPYVGPYEEVGERRRKGGRREMEKRAVAIVHEFLSLTVEKMVEVEKISQFRKWFGIEFNIRDLFLDHPGMFYLSTKGKRDMVFLREAYERGRLVDPNPVYEARMKLLELVMMGRRGFVASSARDVSEEGDDVQDEGEDEGHVDSIFDGSV